MKISEIFSSIQGEGRFAGYPMLFIRTSGCTRKCDFCDTKYHTQGKEYKIQEIIDIIKKSSLEVVCWTGGEPLLRRKDIEFIIKNTQEKWHHIETNGDLLQYSDFDTFNYLGISPKTKVIAKKVSQMVNKIEYKNFDIKVVTDLKELGRNMIEYATMLMPLTTYNESKDKKITQDVWKFCVENNIKFTGRLQSYIFGKKQGI